QVTETPELVTRRRSSTPPLLAALVMQCLEKRAADRPQSAQEVLRVLDAVVPTPTAMASVSLPAVGPLVSPRASVAAVLRWAGAIGAGLLLGAGLAEWRQSARPRESGAVIRVPVLFDDTLRFNSQARSVAISPDGQSIAFIGI